MNIRALKSLLQRRGSTEEKEFSMRLRIVLHQLRSDPIFTAQILVHRFLNWLVEPIGLYVVFLYYFDAVEEENERLYKQVQTLEAQLRELRDQRQEAHECS
jgi:hypothetical protein